jgi:2-polyprenyl-3-methyl-5-hydroxy-6-metoxy-1,4-benzoquinol methylase
MYAVNPFDEIAERYQQALEENLRFIPGGVEYYYENRAKLARKIVNQRNSVGSILDFGGGIGLAIPHLHQQFPHAQISIYDSSAESVSRAVQQHPSTQPLLLDQLSKRKFDLIFVAGVIHHVPLDMRNEILMVLRDSLAPEGTICIFELNPLNPVTRRLVACCPFDEDANLISRRHLETLINEIDGLEVNAGGYTVFLPPVLKLLRPIEKILRWLPLGAQYYLGITSTKT